MASLSAPCPSLKNDDFDPAGDAPLGTNAKSSSPTPPSTPPDDPEKLRRLTRVIRYQAHSQARIWLSLDAFSKGAKYPGNMHRTCACRYLHHAPVNIMHAPDHHSSFYAGLVSCGSPWSCPLCAALIQERRRLEIEQAIAWAESQGLACVLVTLTFPHQAWHRLADLIIQQRDAFKRLRSGKSWMKIKPLGLIRSLEVTHGDNGWHPHTHELWFCERSREPLQADLARLWQSACTRAGLLDPSDPFQLSPFLIHSVDVKHDMTAGDYLAKQDDSRSWGFSHEVAKATSKAGRRKGVHPHRFLIRKAPGDQERFVEYHLAMKGARQLFWSPGLKDRIGVNDISDEVIAEEHRDRADVLAHVPDSAWHLVRGNDARAELLDAAEMGGAPAVMAFLASLGWSAPVAQRSGTDHPRGAGSPLPQ